MAEPVSERRAGRYFLANVSLEQALERWRADRQAAGCDARVEAETLPLDRAVGRVSAEAIWATRSSPAIDVVAMDGIAVCAAETVGATETRPRLLPRSDYEPVDTGEPLPDGFDAVVMREHVHFEGTSAELRAAVAPYHHVRSLGEDVTQTELLLPPGRRLRPVDVAAIAAAGAQAVSARRRPRVAIVPTGDEVRPLGSELDAGDVLDTNSLMLAGQVEQAGCEAFVLAIQPDDPGRLEQALREACADADLVAVIAGSSAGRDDHTAAVVERAGLLSVHGIAVKPGHPVVLGIVEGTPMIGIPGYPVSAALTFELVVAPLLAELEGTTALERPRTTARLARKLPSTMGMDDWVRVRLGRVGSELVAAPLARGAGVLTSLVRADGLLCVPAALEGYEAGAEISVELLRALRDIERTVICTGSHDLVLDVVASTLGARDPGWALATTNVGSLGGLVALRDGLCHLAGSHLLEPATGQYTIPFVEDVLAGRDVAVLRLVGREQGLIVAPGNPLGLSGIEDLTRPNLRYVNRQRGAGTRALLDHELAGRSIDAAAVSGYEREEFTHLSVAAAVANDRADCGLGVRAAARAFELDFVPVATEPYDLVMLEETVDDPLIAPFLDLLDDASFRAEVEALGGYDTSEMGIRIR